MPLPHQFSLTDTSETSSAICNRYELLETIGVGSYGSVYRTKDLKTGEIRAVKSLKLPFSEASAKEYAEGVQEARLLSQMTHPRIVQLLDAFSYQECFYIVMEYCSEGTLDESISRKKDAQDPFPEDQACCWIAQLAEGLAYIHQRKILHRDLKTKNIFLSSIEDTDSPWPDLRIGDFGISRTLVGSTDEASTCIGTPYYFSPEVFKQTGYNHKADMWAVGCILYELSTLSHPFSPADNLPQLMHKVTSKEPTFNSWHTSAGLKSLCRSLLQKSPKPRPSAKEVLASPAIKGHVEKHKMRHQ